MNIYGNHNASDDDGPPDYHKYAAWYDPEKTGSIVFPHWRIVGEHLRSLTIDGIPMRDRVRGLSALLKIARDQRYWMGQDLRSAARGVRAGV